MVCHTAMFHMCISIASFVITTKRKAARILYDHHFVIDMQIPTVLSTFLLTQQIDTCSRSNVATNQRSIQGVPDFERVFLMVKHADIIQNTYVQSWTVTEIMAREKCGLLAVPRFVPISWQAYQCLSLSAMWRYVTACQWCFMYKCLET
jgi:hypothetical protein